MTRLLLFFYAIAAVFKYIANIIGSLFRSKPSQKTESMQVTRDWYGSCENCGTKTSLHTFEGKRYCAMCHARLSAEKKLAKKQKSE